MSTTPRVSSAIVDRPTDLSAALAHCPELAGSFRRLYGTMWTDGIVDQAIKETVRLRNARVTDCAFCKNVRFDGAIGAGLTEDQVDQIDDGYDASTLSERQKVVLRFTDAYLHDPGHVDAAITERLQALFTPAEIVELGLAVTMFLAMSKVLISLGTEPESMDVTVLPTPVAGARVRADGAA